MAFLASPLGRRAFWSRAYARRRLGTERAAPIASLHYALIGEERGYRPNGFFDPRFYRERAGLNGRDGSLLDHYLAGPAAGSPPPSPEFDPAWYVAQNPDWRATHPHPFLHFLEIGLANGRRPRADIDMAFVRDVVRGRGRSIEEAAMRVFDPKARDSDMKPPLSPEELWARQQRFYAASRLRIERETASGRCRLVFVQCGHGFDAPWLAEPRAYDVLLNYYEETEANALADAAVFQAGTKTTAIRRLLAERPDLLLRYEAVLFLDDDVELGAGDIDALFSAAREKRLDLAQPALTDDSEVGLPVSQAAAGAERGLQGFVRRDHGADPDPPRAGSRRLGVRGVGQRLGNRSPARAGGALGVRARQRRGHRIGRGSARAQGRPGRRRFLRLPSPLRHRPSARGEPNRRRLRRRPASQAPRAQ